MAVTAKKRSVARPRESAREEARGAYREAILSAAERVFVKSGFYATRMADIAKEARVAVGTLYNYFESREVILSELLSLRHKEFHARVVAAAVAEDPMTRLRQIVDECLSLTEENGALFATFVERGATGEQDIERLLGEQAHSEYGELLTLLDKTVRACIREKQIRGDVEPRVVVSMLAGAMNGATYSWLKRGRRGRLGSVTEDLFKLFLEGVSFR
jgi:TetR/AcrR family fatty acid metabolism transcriptional regulator